MNKLEQAIRDVVNDQLDAQKEAIVKKVLTAIKGADGNAEFVAGVLAAEWPKGTVMAAANKKAGRVRFFLSGYAPIRCIEYRYGMLAISWTLDPAFFDDLDAVKRSYLCSPDDKIIFPNSVKPQAKQAAANRAHAERFAEAYMPHTQRIAEGAKPNPHVPRKTFWQKLFGGN